MDDWATRRKAELEARAPAKRKKKKLFAVIELDVGSRAFAAMNCPRAMVYVWLLHKARMTGKNTVAVPNGALAAYGVSRKVKYSALRQLEEAGLITMEWPPRKTPMATLQDS
jgi:hypothetical protein